MLVDVAEFEHPTEGGDGGLGGEGAGGGELRLRVDDAGDDEGDDEVTDAARLAGDEGVESELLEGAEDGGDVAGGRLRRQVKASGVEELLAAERRTASMAVSGSLERLARVRFLTRPSSR